MAKIKIYFKGQQYEVDDQLLAEAASAIQGRLAALSGGSTDPDVPDEPDTPDTPDAPNQNTFSVCITYPEYDPSDDRYWTYIEGVTEGMTWRQLTEVNDTLIIEDSEVRNNNAQTVCDANNNIVDPDDVIIEGHTYHVIG